MTPAEKLLHSLGVSDPRDIDLEAIAWLQGAVVKYRRLKGCEARIVGKDNKAVISIDTDGTKTRKRYSLAHELGHWEHHRGQSVICRSSDIYGSKTTNPIERVANRYASDLLMPGYLFDPLAASFSSVSTATVTKLADRFEVSKHAAAIRLVERSQIPCMLVCHGSGGRKAYCRSSQVPATWTSLQNLDARSNAMNILFGSRIDDTQPRKIAADAWFEGRRAQYYELREQTFKSFTGEILTILILDDIRMLDE